MRSFNRVADNVCLLQSGTGWRASLQFAIFSVVLALATPARGAVTVDTTGSCTTTTASCSFSATIAAGSKLALVSANTNSTGRTITSITIGSCTLTQQSSQTESAGANGANFYIYSCANPPTGAQTVTCNWNAANSAACALTTFLGTDGTFGTPVTGTSGSITVASTVGNLVFDSLCRDPSGAETPGGSQTQLAWSPISVSGGNSLHGSTQAGAASVTMSWTGGGTLLQSGIDVHASGGAPACANRIALMGAGCA